MKRIKQLIKKIIKKSLWVLCGKNQKRFDKLAGLRGKIKQKKQTKAYKRACKKGRITRLDIRELFISNASDNKYERLDTIVRYLTIKKYYKNDKDAFALYHKMQEKRLGSSELADEWCERFRNLIDSFEKDGYMDDSLLTVGKNLQIHDGSHRTALCLYNNIFEVSCNVIEYKKKVEYGIEWFVLNQFSRQEITEILNEYHQLIKNFKLDYYLTIENHEQALPSCFINLLDRIGTRCEYIKTACCEENGKYVHIYRFETSSNKYIILDGSIANYECKNIKKMLEMANCNKYIINVCMNYKENDQCVKRWIKQ